MLDENERVEVLEKLSFLKSKLLKRAVPSQEEEREVERVTKKFLNLLRSNLNDSRIEVMLGGSVAKGTWIKGKREFDVFVRFPRDLKPRMHELLFKALSAFTEPQRIPASREYFRVSFEGFEIDVVPVLKISDPRDYEHVTDVSPFHVSYVRAKLREAGNLQNEVRVLKYYLKTIGCYGAESHIAGFSGYSCELLVIFYKSFENVMINLLSSKPPVYIDIENVYGSLSKAKKYLSKDKLKSPIVLIDPVLPTRNAAASLSYETYYKTIFKTWVSLGYAKDCSEKLPGVRILFEPGKIELEEKFLAQLASLKNSLIKKLENYGFFVVESSVKKLDDKRYSVEIWVLQDKLDSVMLHYGPPLWNLEAVKSFIKKSSSNNILGYGYRGSRIYALVKRKFTHIKDYINYLLTSSEIANSKVLKEVQRWYLEDF